VDSALPGRSDLAGACALVTTVHDLARFLDAVLWARLFRYRPTLRSMLDLAPAQDEGGLVGYGLGLEQYAPPGGHELVGHLGGTAGYRSFVGRVRPPGVTLSFVLNAQDDPTPLVIPVVERSRRRSVGAGHGARPIPGLALPALAHGTDLTDRFHVLPRIRAQ
jgi:hypothetical protein